MRKKSIKLACDNFSKDIREIESFLSRTNQKRTPDLYVSWLHNYAVIKLYREFEGFMLECLIALINNDTAALSEGTGYEFPKHLTDEVCEYLIIGNGYFDFKGRDGLIKTTKKYLPANHWFIGLLRNRKYKEPLDQLSALRNYAAHESVQSKRKALNALNVGKIGSAGSWLKKQNRYQKIASKLDELAGEIHGAAPY